MNRDLELLFLVYMYVYTRCASLAPSYWIVKQMGKDELVILHLFPFLTVHFCQMTRFHGTSTYRDPMESRHCCRPWDAVVNKTKSLPSWRLVFWGLLGQRRSRLCHLKCGPHTSIVSLSQRLGKNGSSPAASHTH